MDERGNIQEAMMAATLMENLNMKTIDKKRNFHLKLFIEIPSAKWKSWQIDLVEFDKKRIKPAENFPDNESTLNQ